ncbi:hypothetical protein [Malonomonas rubra]|uniref:hypothetical protein n=1 Tax=Malonomonas rubra TaxID=57040 RepID=UPI0026F08295|nr:hypothetical protein [Malonomonas rubra]
MKVALYEKALDQVALRYAQTIKAKQIEITPAELAAIVENNWPKIVAEALAIHNKILNGQVRPTFEYLKVAA